jgi:cysteine-rich repeat protein
MHVRRYAPSLALVLLAAPAFGQAIPGDVLVTETDAGSVVNVRNGGDLAGAQRFATGLSAPTGICVTFEGDVLVAESGSGEVTNITNGGDFTGAPAFASGLDSPMDLYCEENRILVVERSPGQQGEITNITAGGSFAGAPSFAAGIGTGTTGLAFDPVNERLYASDAGLGRVFDVTNGGVYLSVTPLASNGAGTAGLAVRGEQLLAANPGSDTIRNFAGGGDLAALPVFATVPDVVNVLAVQGSDLLAASANGAVYDVTAGGDFTSEPAFATGLAIDAEFAGMAHFGGCGDGILDGGEACDDGNVAEGDGCNSSCRIRLCRQPRATTCVEAEHASLSVSEKQKRRYLAANFSANLRGWSEAVAVEDFGQPLFDITRYDICVYDGNDELVGQMIVARGFDVCGPKEKSCWSAIGDKGVKYNDPDLDSGGIGSIVAQSGAAGKGSLAVKGRRKRDEDRLPRMTEALAGSSKATIQVMVSDDGISIDDACFSAELPNVKRAEEGRFQATK